MPPGLMIRIQRSAPFKEVLDEAQRVLSVLTKSDSIPPFQLQIPPGAKYRSALECSSVDEWFSAYVTLQGIAGSMVDFSGFLNRRDLLVGCAAAGRTACSDVLVAAMSIAAARMLDGQIVDDQGKWTSKEECSADELIAALALPEEQRGLGFLEALLAVSRNQVRPPSYGTPSTECK